MQHPPNKMVSSRPSHRSFYAQLRTNNWAIQEAGGICVQQRCQNFNRWLFFSERGLSHSLLPLDVNNIFVRIWSKK